MARKTLDATLLIDTANARIEHLSAEYTKEAADKRHAIISLVSDVLIEGNAYRGFRYLEEPTRPMPGQIGLQYDNSRSAFFGGARVKVSA